MFDNITKDLIKKLLHRYYDGDVSKVPTIDYLAPPPPPPPATLVKSVKAKGNLTFQVPTPVPNTGIWLENLTRCSSQLAKGPSYQRHHCSWIIIR